MELKNGGVDAVVNDRPVNVINKMLNNFVNKYTDEMIKLTEEKGMTIIPYRLYFKENLIKLEVCLCKGRDYSGKKQLLKERDIQRDAQREIKNIKRLS